MAKTATRKIQTVHLVAQVSEPGKHDGVVRSFNADKWQLTPSHDEVLGSGVTVSARPPENVPTGTAKDPRQMFVPITNIKSIDFKED